MKKLIALLAAAILALAIPAGSVPAARAEGNSWTVLVYLCGTDLESDEGQATGDIREMISSGAGASSSVEVLIATGGSTQWQRYGISSRSVQYYRLGDSAPELQQDLGSRNMGDANTLSDFLRYGIAAAPADHYILVLWDHGGGPVFGLCNDANFRDDSLSLDELKNALAGGLGGTKLDIIGFDCCLMNCLDLCGDLYGLADYAVLSQELVSGTGLDYDAWMQPLAANPSMAAREVARAMAETYVAENSRGRDAGTATMSVIETGKMPPVVEAAEAFSTALSGQVASNLAGVVRLRNQLTSFGEFLDYDASDLVDVEDMCDAFSVLLPQESARLKAAAQQAVCFNFTTSDIASYAHGLSFFLPGATVQGDKQEILSHYSSQPGAYAALAVAMTNGTASSGYSISASSYTPSSFYSSSGSGPVSGSICDIWDGLYGGTCSFDEVYSYCGGNIWAGLNSQGGSVWEGYPTGSGIWAGFGGQGTAQETPSFEGIWSGLPSAETPAPAVSPAPAGQTAATALDSIWAGLIQGGADYYHPGEDNQNVQAGISEALPAQAVLEAADSYFSASTLTSQMIYSIQLNRNDLDHLSKASGVLSIRDGEETVRLGNMGLTTIDWSTGLVFSMFDGSWPMLEDQMVRAEFLYEDEEGNVRFVIPARINGLKMYLLGVRAADGKVTLQGATQGYDENGFAIRGSIALEPGMKIRPLFTATAADGSEREYEGNEITVPAEGLRLAWGRIPAGDYLYCFGLTDLSGTVHYTDSEAISF